MQAILSSTGNSNDHEKYKYVYLNVIELKVYFDAIENIKWGLTGKIE